LRTKRWRCYLTRASSKHSLRSSYALVKRYVLRTPSGWYLTPQQKVLLGGKASLAIANAIGRVGIMYDTAHILLTSV